MSFFRLMCVVTNNVETKKRSGILRFDSRDCFVASLLANHGL